MSQNRELPQATVLVVEDNAILMMNAVQIVEDAGYLAVEAVNSEQALALLESNPDIAVMFTDIEMPPGMDGLGLARVVHDRWPLVSLVIASGRVCPSAAEMPEHTTFLTKPYSATDVEDAFDQGQPGKERA
jgi:CheY-like chemotaxis protein